jgi:hypothetical protein
VGPLAGSGFALAATPGTGEDGVREVIGRYERAIEMKDVTFFRSIKPNLSGEEEKRLRRAFGSTRTQEVTIVIESIRLEGPSAGTRRAGSSRRSEGEPPQSFQRMRQTSVLNCS